MLYASISKKERWYDCLTIQGNLLYCHSSVITEALTRTRYTHEHNVRVDIYGYNWFTDEVTKWGGGGNKFQ